MHAAGHRTASVVRAHVVVVAIRCCTAVASASAARVVRRASIAVITRQRVVRVDTTCDHVARVCRAWVAVAAHHRTAAANSTRALIIRGTGVVVIARISVVGVHASVDWVAAIGCTNVAIAATQRRAQHTHMIDTGLDTRAHVVIVAICASFAARRRRGSRLTFAVHANLGTVTVDAVRTAGPVRIMIVHAVSEPVARVRVVACAHARIAAGRTV